MKLAIAGASGRMGRMLIEAALAEPGTTAAAAFDRTDSPKMGRDCGEFLGQVTGARITGDLAALAGCDVLIDFTRPEARRYRWVGARRRLGGPPPGTRWHEGAPARAR